MGHVVVETCNNLLQWNPPCHSYNSSSVLNCYPRNSASCAGGLEWGDSGAALARMERVAKDKDSAREAAQQPIVDSWACLKAFAAAYEDVCGRLTMYAARHTLYAPLPPCTKSL